MKYTYDKHFLVCTGERCNDPDRGDERGEAIRNALKDLNTKRGRKKSVRVCAVSCLDLCDYGPNMLVYPEGTAYAHLDRASARAVYEGETGDGPAVPEKELAPDEIPKNQR